MNKLSTFNFIFPCSLWSMQICLWMWCVHIYRKNCNSKSRFSIALVINICSACLWGAGSSLSSLLCWWPLAQCSWTHFGSMEWGIFTFLLHRLHTIHSFDLGSLQLRLKLHGQWMFVCIWISSRLTLILTQILWAWAFSTISHHLLYKHEAFLEFDLSVVLFTHVHVCSSRANLCGVENGPSSFIKVLLTQQWCINFL